MKNSFRLFCGVFAVSAFFAVPLTALAQTCAAPTNIASAPASGTDNTCSSPTGTGTNAIGTYCGAIASAENEIIYSVTLGSGATGSFNVTNVQAGFNPAIVLFNGTCANGGSGAGATVCNPVDAAGASNGTNPSGNETMPLSGQTAGNYFIAVTGSPTSGTCGSYSWNVTATLPVKLQKFSVK